MESQRTARGVCGSLWTSREVTGNTIGGPRAMPDVMTGARAASIYAGVDDHRQHTSARLISSNMSFNKKLILVIGATGAQGIAVVDKLLEPGADGSPSPYAVRALTRNPSSRRASRSQLSAILVHCQSGGTLANYAPWTPATDDCENSQLTRGDAGGTSGSAGLSVKPECHYR